MDNKTYILKVVLNIQSSSKLEVERMAENYIKELPRMNGVTIHKAELMDNKFHPVKEVWGK